MSIRFSNYWEILTHKQLGLELAFKFLFINRFGFVTQLMFQLINGFNIGSKHVLIH